MFLLPAEGSLLDITTREHQQYECGCKKICDQYVIASWCINAGYCSLTYFMSRTMPCNHRM